MSDLISRQAAIDAIENAFDRETILNRFVRKIAISAVRLLPSAQPEPCEDAVSRTDVLKFKCDCYDSEGHLLYAVPTGYILRLKPVTPKQRMGKWIPQDHNKRVGNISTCVYCYPTCSECGKVGIETYKYCPHCGAKMTEGVAE